MYPESPMGENIRQMEKLSSISRFIASVAHEINNPLTVISGYTQMLLQKVKESNECEICEITRRGLEKIEKKRILWKIDSGVGGFF
jgi:signal transduction histidine kinase